MGRSVDSQSFKLLRSPQSVMMDVLIADIWRLFCYGTQALLSTGFKMPERGILFSAQETMLEAVTHAAFELGRLGFKLYATPVREMHTCVHSQLCSCIRCDVSCVYLVLMSAGHACLLEGSWCRGNAVQLPKLG